MKRIPVRNKFRLRMIVVVGVKEGMLVIFIKYTHTHTHSRATPCTLKLCPAAVGLEHSCSDELLSNMIPSLSLRVCRKRQQ